MDLLAKYKSALETIEQEDITIEEAKRIASAALNVPLRTLTPEEYEAKVAAGKKIVLSEDQGKSPRNQD